MPSTTLILGAGFGGISAARTLRERLSTSEHRIVVIDRGATFHVGAAKNWVMLDYSSPEQIEQPIEALLPDGVAFLQTDVQHIDAGGGEVRTADGTLRADYLVIALGAELNTGAIPGLDGADTFYSLEGAIELREKLRAFEGGRVVVLIVGKPYKCPPAPYEAAMLLHGYFQERGIRGEVDLSLHTFEGVPLMTAGEEMGRMMGEMLAERGIGLHLRHTAKSIDASAGTIAFQDGTEAAFDLLLAVPPNRAPAVVRESGLTDASGWIPVDPRTLEVETPHGRTPVFAIGDVTRIPLPGRYKPDVPLGLPKAGVMAEAHGRVVGERIAALARGMDPTALFDGQGFCYIETGRHEATRGGGSFFALPHPQTERHPPGAEHHREKLAWVKAWLTPVRET